MNNIIKFDPTNIDQVQSLMINDLFSKDIASLFINMYKEGKSLPQPIWEELHFVQYMEGEILYELHSEEGFVIPES